METNFISFTKTKLPFGWMGNMSPFPVMVNGITYLTTEALFQSMRFDDVGIKALIRREKSPMMAKLVAKAHKQHMVVQPLSNLDVENMKFCISLKLAQHPELKDELLLTVSKIIYEDVTARGAGGSNLFWGALQIVTGEWFGKNVMGQIWMEETKIKVHILRVELILKKLR